MSRTLFVEFRGNGFWAFDAVSSVFLKYLIDAATTRIDGPDDAWLSDAVKSWRVNAVISDLGLYLDDSWSLDQIKTVTAIATEACDMLSTRDMIPAEEIESWQMVDELHCFARGLPGISTASAIRLGEAVIKLVNGTLPEPPPGTWWFFTVEDGATLGKRDQA